LETFDLIDFFLPRNNKISPPNKIKESIEAIHNDNIVRNRYKGIGVCNVSQIIEPADLERLCKYYLVWSKLASSYHQHASTISNFQFSEYINEFLYDPTGLPSNDKILEYIKRLKNGWNYPIEIIAAYDTAINKGLIVDGTIHSLALYYIKQREEEERLQTLLRENNEVNLCQMNSLQCRNIFYHDFARLISSS
jgi:hypothetical protein